MAETLLTAPAPGVKLRKSGPFYSKSDVVDWSPLIWHLYYSGVPTRLCNAVHYFPDIYPNSLEGLRAMSRKDMGRVPNVGKKSIDLLREVLGLTEQDRKAREARPKIACPSCKGRGWVQKREPL